jgi:DNA-binding CsgD family transcriptional regulator
MNTTPAPLHFTLARTPATMIAPERFTRHRAPAPRSEPTPPASALTEPHAGLALEMLERIDPQERRGLVVVTQNPCPEYAADLWDLGPAILLIGAPPATRLARALEDAGDARRYRDPAAFESTLIPSERAILRFLPRGTCNKRIASRLGLSDRTVRNRLVDIGEKLGLENRTQIAMYYAGQWQWLERYRSMLTMTQAQGVQPEQNGWNAN